MIGFGGGNGKNKYNMGDNIGGMSEPNKTSSSESAPNSRAEMLKAMITKRQPKPQPGLATKPLSFPTTAAKPPGSASGAPKMNRGDRIDEEGNYVVSGINGPIKFPPSHPFHPNNAKKGKGTGFGTKPSSLPSSGAMESSDSSGVTS